jgi:Zn-finger nucleic acid-binding protein
MPTPCPSCGNPVHAGRAACLYCGTAAPEVSAPLPDSASCPRCRHAMKTVEVTGIFVDVCPGCGGTWYDRGEFEAHLDHVSRHRTGSATGLPPAIHEASSDYLPCARCGMAMLRKNFDGGSGVLVDVCGEHGVFLDAGELRQIVEYVGSERQRTVQQLREAERLGRLERKVDASHRVAMHAVQEARTLRNWWIWSNLLD